jgi:hypothetical protein
VSASPPTLEDAWWSALAASQSRAPQLEVKGNVNRGRTLVRTGKVVGLQITPGLVTADVIDGDTHAVSVRIKTFGNREWDKVTDALASDLGSVTALFEGMLPAAFIERLHRAGMPLLPGKDDVEGDCDCGDHVYPCAHLAAVHLFVGQVIGSDPLELFTLRGRGRDVLLDALRKAWGGGDRHTGHARPLARFDDDPYASPVPLEGLRFDFHTVDEAPGAGLRALGPIPGDADLLKALAPLYEAGSRTAVAVALGDTTVAPEVPVAVPMLVAEPPPRVRRKAGQQSIDAILGAAPANPVELPLTERIVEALGGGEGVLVSELVKRTQATPQAVKQELAELEALGLVYRAQGAGPTRWHLG